jgi:hypothetical protein
MTASLTIRWITGDCHVSYYGHDLDLTVTGEDEQGNRVVLNIDQPSIVRLNNLLHDAADLLLSQAVDKSRPLEATLHNVQNDPVSA